MSGQNLEKRWGRSKEAYALTPFGKTLFHKLVKEGVLPKPRKVGRASVHDLHALRDAVDRYIESRSDAT
jgi:predicted DNA-binding transcriptional regulator AlpA